MTEESFRKGFDRLGARVRFRLALRRMISWAAVGLCVGAIGAGAAWYLRKGKLRPALAALGAVGLAAGAAIAHRRRLRDHDLAQYLDAKLASDETLTTALELEAKESDGDDARAVVLAQAERTLASAHPSDVEPTIWRRHHAAIVLGAAGIAFASLLPLPPAPPPPPPPAGSDEVKADLAALDRLARIDKVTPRDEAQRKRLEKLAEEARKLREKIQAGTPRREALSDLAKLQEGLAAEKLSLGDGEERQGMESALGKLAERGDMKGVERALGDRDLVKLDDEMEKLANRLEQQDRERAKKTLEQAAEAARKNKAENVAKALEEQKKRLDEQGKKNDKLKQLAEAMGKDLPDDAKKALEDMKKDGSPKSQKQLADAMEKALAGLSDAERKQLAENLKKQAEKMSDEPQPGGGPSKQEMKDLAKKLETPEGQKELAEQMKELAKKPPPSDEAKRQKEIEQKQKDAGDAQEGLGQTPMPTPGPGAPTGLPKDKPPGKDAQGKGKDGKDGPGKDGPGKDGPGKDGPGKDGPGNGKDHKDQKDGGDAQPGHSDGGKPDGKKPPGMTQKVDAARLDAKAKAKIGKGKLMPGQVLGRSSGRPGDKANVVGTGALGDAKAGELSGIDRSEVPEEYREQVGRYFDPR